MTKRIPAASRLNPGPEPLRSKDATKPELMAMVQSMAYGAGLEVPEKLLARQKKQELLSVVNGMASFVSRSALQSALGQSFNGKRGLYDVFGWKKEILFIDYLNAYDRNGIAARVVDIKADESWRKFPYLHDGKTSDDYNDETAFLKAWLELVEAKNLSSVFNELDIALGISRFAVIVIGEKGVTDYAKPLDKNNNGTRQIEFLRVLDEGQVTMSSPVNDVFSPRYGLPETYRCQFEEDGPSVPVHWTRVLHFKQGRGRSNIYGIPGLKKSFNNLQDLEKVVGASSEAYWQHIRRAVLLSAREGFTLPEKGTPAYNDMLEQVDNLEHQMSLTIRLKNMEATQLGSQAVDGANQTNLLVSVVSGTEGIPQRILLGSERGELASTQDVRALYSTIEARQTKTCEPWLRQFVVYCYEWGFIPAPSSGKFQVEWQSLYQPSPMEKIDIAKGEAEVINLVTGDNFESYMDIEDFFERHLDGYKKYKSTQKKSDKATLPDGGGENEENTTLEDAGLKDMNVTEKVMA